VHSFLGFLFLACDLYKVSVFDSVVQGGDSVWEGLRVYSGKIFKLDEHLDRLVKEKFKKR
jgi:branched-subunit amino acid aminotransferase/4-amino-4-deoxychorismate lyase